MVFKCQEIILYNKLMTASLEKAPQVPEKNELNTMHEPHVTLVLPGVEGWSDATNLEAITFIRRQFVGSSEELAEEYESYLSKTSMIVVRNPDTPDKVSACARMVDYDPNVGFKTTDDALNSDKSLEISETGWETLDSIDHEDIAEVGTISARAGAGAELYGAIIGFGLDREPGQECHFVIASLDEQVLTRLIKPLFGDSVKILGPAADYMGSMTVPILIDLERAWDNAVTNNQFPGATAKVITGRESLKRDR
jgi:hypothetical protein